MVLSKADLLAGTTVEWKESSMAAKKADMKAAAKVAYSAYLTAD